VRATRWKAVVPVVRAGAVRFAHPARHDGDRCRDAALGDRNADDGGHAEGGRHPGDDLPGDAGPRQRRRLLTAAAEEERVATLETDHDG